MPFVNPPYFILYNQNTLGHVPFYFHYPVQLRFLHVRQLRLLSSTTPSLGKSWNPINKCFTFCNSGASYQLFFGLNQLPGLWKKSPSRLFLLVKIAIHFGTSRLIIEHWVYPSVELNDLKSVTGNRRVSSHLFWFRTIFSFLQRKQKAHRYFSRRNGRKRRHCPEENGVVTWIACRFWPIFS